MVFLISNVWRFFSFPFLPSLGLNCLEEYGVVTLSICIEVSYFRMLTEYTLLGLYD